MSGLSPPTSDPSVAGAAPTVRTPLNLIGARLGVLLVSHTAVDVYAAIVLPIAGVLQVRLDLTGEQTAWLIGAGSISSGVSQPVAAWVSDRLDSRLFGPLGLLIAAVCISCIGLADSYVELIVLYTMGMAGAGVYHPVGASSMGQLSERRIRGPQSRSKGIGEPWPGRSLGLSFFFVAGMAGGVIGSYCSPQLIDLPIGFAALRWLMIPGLLLAVILLLATRHVPHRHDDHRSIVFSRAEVGQRWTAVALLYFANAIRFTVNMALYYLLIRWAQALYRERQPQWTEAAIADAAADINGVVNACLIIGMAIGGMTAGTLIAKGKEKLPLALQPILFAPFIAMLPLAGQYGGYALAVMCGIGFASMIPVTLSVGQRLLPHRTSLASGLLLGGAWAVAALGPAGAEYFLQQRGLSLEQTFTLTAALLAMSGVLALPLRASLLRG